MIIIKNHVEAIVVWKSNDVICKEPQYSGSSVVFLLPFAILAKDCPDTPHILSAADADNPSVLPKYKRMIERLMALTCDDKPALKELILFDNSFTLWMVGDIWLRIKQDVLRIIEQELLAGGK